MEIRFTYLFSVTLFFLYLFDVISSLEVSFTVEVLPGKRECFHQHFSLNSAFEIDYQVIEGGDMDVNFYIQSPSGRVMVSEIRKQDSLHKVDAIEEGPYAFCFDNSFSRFSNKFVFFEIVSESEETTFKKPDEERIKEIESQYEIKISNFWDTFDRMTKQMDQSKKHQQLLRVQEIRDRSMQEANFTRVNFWSAVQLGIMISVGLVQVLMIRQLFKDTSRSTKHMKMST